jgi:anti-anti-sigma factor
MFAFLPAEELTGGAVTEYSYRERAEFCIIRAMEQMDVEQEPSRVNDVTVFRLKGPFTLSTMFSFQSTLKDANVKGVIVDLEGVPFIDSTGLGVLLREYAHTLRGGHKFAIVGMHSRVRTIFDMTQTYGVLPIFASQAEAEASF